MGESSIIQLLSPDDPTCDPRDALGVAVGRRIRDRRRSLGLTQAELAAPLTKSYVSAVERGRVLPSLRVLLLLAGRLGVGVGDLVGDVNPDLTGAYNAGHGTSADHDAAAPPHDR